MALLILVHAKLFGEESGAIIVGKSIRDQEDPIFGLGRMRGSQELVEFFRSKTPAMGLTGYLLHGET